MATDAAKNNAGIFIQQMGHYDTHKTMLTTRLKTGDAEVPQDWCDIFVVTAGEVSLVSGGHLVDGRVIAPGEMSGNSIEGGVAQALHPGSVVHIDAEIPHQLIVDPGKSLTYFVVKIKSGIRVGR